jgi:hypothetical protein
MVKGITFNYRTDKDGGASFDICFVGEEYQYVPTFNVIVDDIMIEPDKSATIHTHTLDEKEKVDKTYVITQTNIHSVLEELE